jgi:hypothetical protein
MSWSPSGPEVAKKTAAQHNGIPSHSTCPVIREKDREQLKVTMQKFHEGYGSVGKVATMQES